MHNKKHHNSNRLDSEGEKVDMGTLQPESGEQKVIQFIEEIGLDGLNLAYFKSLLNRKYYPHQDERLRIYDGTNAGMEWTDVYPTAICSPSLIKELPYIHYSELISHPTLAESAKESALWIRPMQAGTGSTIIRDDYLRKRQNRSDFQLGAKGTDLFVEIEWEGEKKEVSLAELQILRAYCDSKRSQFGEIIFQDIVSQETQKAIKQIWDRPSLPKPNLTYKELFSELSNLSYFKEVYQNHLPTLNEHGELTLNRKAPGGHGLFGMQALRSAYLDSERPTTEFPLIGVTANGEDLSGLPDPLMVGYMVQNQIPIIMVTTEKTENDVKGGQIAVIPRGQGKAHVTIIEKAQAQNAGQLPLFEEIGLRSEDGMAFFNTNMALFNYQILVPMLKNLVSEIGESEFFNMMAPTLIENWKEQVDSDGEKRRYLQLEGALGSVLLNLDRFWRDHYGRPLVHIINVPREYRTQFFSPIKTAFDYFMQFHSDRFQLDQKSLRLVDQRPGEIPEVELDAHYHNLQNLLNDFQGASLLHLRTLKIKGQVDLSHFVLRGDISIVNNSGRKVNLRDFFPARILDSESITIDSNGDLRHNY